MPDGELSVVELCAGAGGQSVGLEAAGFAHQAAVELDPQAADTLRANRPWDVRCGDVADPGVWDPAEHAGVDLLAGGVPCPPFSVAGKQLGAADERDLFAWAVETTATVRPKALLLENVRGLSGERFAGYRQHVRDRLSELGYWSDWRLLNACDYGVPQLRPRFVLVALQRDHAAGFSWPAPAPSAATVGSTLVDLMGAGGWRGAKAWARRANTIAPTLVGGSKKHGGADLGPTRAKKAWLALGVDAMGVADAPPPRDTPAGFVPKLTCDMVARLQGWNTSPEFAWAFTGRKTSRYRQIGNAFPPPVARALGRSIHDALTLSPGAAQPGGATGSAAERAATAEAVHDPVYRALRSSEDFVTLPDLAQLAGELFDAGTLARRVEHLARDFEIDIRDTGGEPAYLLRGFRGFTGQPGHDRHERFARARGTIS